ncbi:MAG: HDIG domain-containing protein [Bacteroidales bacterium]|jgi:putative nucleotidyltransferase with HDIG domain|nr:HDIG domain-containing protein [Bacteroidales bacterium]
MKFDLKKYSVVIYTVILFLLSVTIVVYIFPKDKKFEYSFVEGSPWLHEDMIAAFDFPIYRTDKELQVEKDSVVKNFIPYYYIDTTVFGSITSDFVNKLHETEETKILTYYDNSKTLRKRYTNPKTYLDRFNRSADSLINKIYRQGLIILPDTLDDYGNYKFYVFKNKIYELSFQDEFYEKKNVEDLFMDVYNHSGVKNIDSLNDYPIYNLIKSYEFRPNILYDSNVSNEMLNKQIKSISPTMGIVQTGELIISKGSIVGEKENKMLLSLKKETEADDSNVNRYLISIGVILLFFSLYFVVYLCYFFFYNRQVLLSFKNNTFFTLQMLLIIFSVFVVFKYTDLNINIIPFTLVPALLITFYRFHISFFVYLLTIFVAGFFAPNSFEFIFIQTITGMVAMFSLRKKQRRRQIFITLLLVFVSYMIIYIGFVLMRQGSFSELLKNEMFSYAISSAFLLLYLPIVYIYEKVFGFISDFTLMEISDTNSPALRELAEKAPGTFQHSVQVANIVESVVRELGGDYLLARAGALYHDIGKLEAPEIFIENQNGENIHDKFDLEESAQKIISHVKYGEDLAHKYHLPKQIVDFITMHHGTSVTRYFYNSWINSHPGQEPVISNFKYPGPKPQTLETAVMMMADAIEAASRTLKEYTPESIDKLVNGIVNQQLNDGQFDEVEITLKQITIAKSIFVSKIKNIYHTRITYPDVEEKK